MMKMERVCILLLKDWESSSKLKRMYKRTQGISTTEIMDKIVNIDNKEEQLGKIKRE